MRVPPIAIFTPFDFIDYSRCVTPNISTRDILSLNVVLPSSGKSEKCFGKSENEKVKKSVIRFKITGGAAAQVLAFYNILYFQSNHEGLSDLEVVHYESGTGAYFPLAIKELLEIAGMGVKVEKARNVSSNVDLRVGEVIQAHELFQPGLKREKLVEVIRKLGIESHLKRLKKEWMLQYQIDRLKNVPNWVKVISGGYMPFVDIDTRMRLEEMFNQSSMQSIFLKKNDVQYFQESAVIHYRLGNKRATFSSPELGGKVNSIIDAGDFPKILSSLEKKPKSVFVVSDDFQIAQKLLLEVGIHAEKNPLGTGIWNDLALMNAAGYLLCPWSTVSQLAIACSASPSKKIFYPATDGAGTTPLWRVSDVKYYRPSYLPEHHWLYDGGFDYPEEISEGYFNDRR